MKISKSRNIKLRDALVIYEPGMLMVFHRLSTNGDTIAEEYYVET